MQIDSIADLSSPWRQEGDCAKYPLVAAVLPPREGFGSASAGAIAQIVHRQCLTPGFRALVIGGAQQSPTFGDVEFRVARPPLWLPGNINTRYAAGAARLLRRTLPAALVEVHNRPEVALALARRLPATPIALFLHNDPQSMRAARKPAERRTLLQRLAGVVTVSEFLRERLMEGVGAPARMPFVLPNCIDLGSLPPPARREPLILFVGRAVPEKAPDAFVAACARALPQLPGWRAELIGADRFQEDSPDTRYLRQVSEAAQQSGVALLGYRTHAEVLKALARASIVVVPSRWPEPFGLVALEAMASGAALVCSPRGGLPEVAGEAALYAEPDNPAALAEAVMVLAHAPERRELLAAAGRERARQFDLPPTLAALGSLRRGWLSALR